MKRTNLIARQKLDEKFAVYKGIKRPPRGWIKAIREALGMTAVQLAKRLSIRPPTLFALEKREQNKSVTLKQLEKVAEQLGCRVDYVFVPHQPLTKMVETRADQLAHKTLAAISKSMELEDQKVIQEDFDRQLAFLKEELLNGPEKYLWKDEDV